MTRKEWQICSLFHIREMYTKYFTIFLLKRQSKIKTTLFRIN